MKKILLLSLFIIYTCNCSKVDYSIVWSGDKVIPSTGGTSIWKPKDDDARLYPVINALFLSLYDSDGECIKMEELQDTHGEWYDIKTSMNLVSIHLSANDTGYTRELQVAFDDGVNRGGYSIGIIQSIY